MFAGLSLQVVGVGTDAAYHLANPHVRGSPAWVHAPAWLGIAVTFVVLTTLLIHRRMSNTPVPLVLAIAMGAAVVQVAAMSWSIAVEAEKNNFYVPVAFVATAGVVLFAIVVGPWVEARLPPNVRDSLPLLRTRRRELEGG